MKSVALISKFGCTKVVSCGALAAASRYAAVLILRGIELLELPWRRPMVVIVARGGCGSVSTGYKIAHVLYNL